MISNHFPKIEDSFVVMKIADGFVDKILMTMTTTTIMTMIITILNTTWNAKYFGFLLSILNLRNVDFWLKVEFDSTWLTSSSSTDKVMDGKSLDNWVEDDI